MNGNRANSSGINGSLPNSQSSKVFEFLILVVLTRTQSHVEISKKVVLAGHFGVGKTSLIRRFVHQQFSDQYLTTIGVKIDKKIVSINGATINLILWDVAGEQSSVKIPKSYFAGAHALMYIFDLTRPETYTNLDQEIFEIAKINQNIQTCILGNKSDAVTKQEIEAIRENAHASFETTSALNGENVEETFLSLAKKLL